MTQHTSNQHIILFDGYCHLCDGTVNILLKIDRNDQLRFASLQSDFAKSALKKYSEATNHDSILLLESSGVASKSTAVLGIIRLLPWYWHCLLILNIFPTKVLDGIYDWIARNRYRLLGKRKTCRMPSPKEKAKFIA